MTMKIIKLQAHWSADEAYTVIEWLDLMRDSIFDAYGEEITAMLKEASAPQSADQRELPFDDDLNF